MIDSKEYIRAWNERVGETTAHLRFDNQYLEKQALYQSYESSLNGMDLSGKTVIDWGCGGGLFAEWLFLYHNVKEYRGFDIADRSIAAAKKRMADYPLPEGVYRFTKIDPEEMKDISLMKSDIFICLSVIHHFPDQEYLDLFLESVNAGRFKNLILQIRHNTTTEFRPEPYKTTHDIALACHTNSDYLQEKLTNYKFTSLSMIAKNGYQYLVFEKKRRGRPKKQ